MIRACCFALLIALAGATLPSDALSSSPAPAAHVLIAHILDRNPSLHTFQARLHVRARMLSFPFFSPHLDGTAYYKRPGNFEIVFDRVPSYARGFKQLFSDMADPGGWERESNVAYSGVNTVDGHAYFTLTLTKKTRSDQLKAAVAFVDPGTYEVARMEWDYVNGDRIVLAQSYRDEGPYSVVSSQHAEIHRRVRAVADATYDRYNANVPVSDRVFTKQ